ncbi:hypothetical protein M422DRAFT_43460 [Sphaerobolus stellatus SS14]|nr:hypothetical protein M422DRAFT_43460 [Sphaerobolus stellatus SS14]
MKNQHQLVGFPELCVLTGALRFFRSYPTRVLDLTPSDGIPDTQISFCCWPIEDTKQEARDRRARAREIAVDLSSLSNGDQISHRWVSGSKQVDTLVASTSSAPTQLPNMVVTERITRSQPENPEIETQNNPHSIKVKCCPVISVSKPSELETKKKRRRKRTSVPKERPAPGFFRPLESWGGKSAGYAMGYRGSLPVKWRGLYRYARDVMQKAALGRW